MNKYDEALHKISYMQFSANEEYNVIKEVLEKANNYDNLLLQLQRWADLLNCDGINSKSMVRNDIEQYIKEHKK